MEFCEKCGGIILVESNKAICMSCRRKIKKKPKIEISEKADKKKEIEIIKEEADNVYPIIEIDCLKCKNKKAYFWTLQTRSSDEAETKFYKCTKCKYTWRKYR